VWGGGVSLNAAQFDKKFQEYLDEQQAESDRLNLDEEPIDF
jgi:hypothetical protein